MFFSILILAISSSIDSLGIGITYGLKRIELKKWTRLILFCISILVTILSIISGNILKNIFSENFFKLIGTVILVLMGLLIVFKTDCEDQTFDLDNSNVLYTSKNQLELLFLSHLFGTYKSNYKN